MTTAPTLTSSNQPPYRQPALRLTAKRLPHPQSLTRASISSISASGELLCRLLQLPSTERQRPACPTIGVHGAVARSARRPCPHARRGSSRAFMATGAHHSQGVETSEIQCT